MMLQAAVAGPRAQPQATERHVERLRSYRARSVRVRCPVAPLITAALAQARSACWKINRLEQDMGAVFPGHMEPLTDTACDNRS